MNKKLILAISAAITLAVAITIAVVSMKLTKSPPLPASLAAIQCQQDSDKIAPQGYDVIKADENTNLFAPCTRPGESAKNRPHIFSSHDATAGTFYLKRANDGKGTFMITDDASDPYPKRAVTDYMIYAAWSHEEASPWRSNITSLETIEIATPGAFARTGPVTTFYCKDLRSAVQECLARARSQSLFWVIHIKYGYPYALRMRDMGLTEVYQLIADHIVQKSNSKAATPSASASSSRKTVRPTSQSTSVVLSAEVDAETLEEYETSDAARKPGETEPFGSALTSERVSWSSEMIPIPFDKNPYTTVLTITGRTRTDGAARTNWRVGWLVDDRMSVLYPIKNLQSEPLAAGQTFTLTSPPFSRIFKEGVRAVALVELLETDNAVIDKVSVRVTAGD